MDIQSLKETLKCYGKASSAAVNWSKSDALWCGREVKGPIILGGLQWGVLIGIKEYRNKNWEGLVEKTCARLSC